MLRACQLGRVGAFLLILGVYGCDGDGMDADGGTDMDAGGGGSCVSEPDGTSCGSGLICLSEECVSSTCGDGFVDDAAGEVCDDGNQEAFDGCEPATCTPTCTEASQCSDGLTCNGDELCTDNVCEFGTPLADGESCTRPMGGDGVCRTGECVMAGCGNGVPDMGEDCDDGNMVAGDGCENDCTFSCTTDEECIDSDMCNGTESCDMTTNACVPGTMLDCSDGDECTMDLCEPLEGCSNPLIDGDMDGHAPDTLACGTDCDDTRPDVYTGAEELCDGVDNNCNTDIDEVAPTWFVDCDGDGFAADTAGSRVGCTEPPASATGCGGGWTSVRPVDASTTDCGPTNPVVFPGQTMYFTTAIPGSGGSYDYNCDGAESRQYGCSTSCSDSGGTCSGSAGFAARSDPDNPNGCAFVCSGGPFCFYSPPGCGIRADYDGRCTTFIGSCRRIGTIPPQEQTQACR